MRGNFYTRRIHAWIRGAGPLSFVLSAHRRRAITPPPPPSPLLTPRCYLHALPNMIRRYFSGATTRLKSLIAGLERLGQSYAPGRTLHVGEGQPLQHRRLRCLPRLRALPVRPKVSSSGMTALSRTGAHSRCGLDRCIISGCLRLTGSTGCSECKRWD